MNSIFAYPYPDANTSFGAPSGLSNGPDGAIYVADEELHCIWKISANGQVAEFAGHPGSKGFSNGKGCEARFCNPRNICAFPDGSLRVWDRKNASIRRIEPDGTVSTIFTLPQKMHDSISFYQVGLAIDDDENLCALFSDCLFVFYRNGNIIENMETKVGLPAKKSRDFESRWRGKMCTWYRGNLLADYTIDDQTKNGLVEFGKNGLGADWIEGVWMTGDAPLAGCVGADGALYVLSAPRGGNHLKLARYDGQRTWFSIRESTDLHPHVYWPEMPSGITVDSQGRIFMSIGKHIVVANTL